MDKAKFLRFKNAAIAYIRIAKVELVVLAAMLFVDLVSKYLVATNINLNSSITIIPNFLHFYYTRNYNAAFSMDFGLGELLGAKGITVFFIAITIITTMAFLLAMYMFRRRRKFLLVMIALIIAGAIGNLVDRAMYGYVRDFVYIEYFGKELGSLGRGFAIFNIADLSLVVGMIGIVWYVIFMYTKDVKRLSATSNVSSDDASTAVASDVLESNKAIDIEHKDSGAVIDTAVEQATASSYTVPDDKMTSDGKTIAHEALESNNTIDIEHKDSGAVIDTTMETAATTSMVASAILPDDKMTIDKANKQSAE